MKEVADNNNLTLEKQKELYVATIVHDLKNPLNAQIIALEQLVKEKFGSLTIIQKEILNDIISSAKFMSEMLCSMLIIYKFENGIVKLNKTPVNIDILIKTCIRNIKIYAEEQLVFIEYTNKSVQNILFCDENYMRRVITNMLNNLITYSYKNTKPVIILEDDDLSMIIRFKSNGYPINENLKPHIFDKYISSNSKNFGTGLGLYFCKKVIEAHSGIISLNAKDSDIEFFIKMPKVEETKNIIKFN